MLDMDTRTIHEHWQSAYQQNFTPHYNSLSSLTPTFFRTQAEARVSAHHGIFRGSLGHSASLSDSYSSAVRKLTTLRAGILVAARFLTAAPWVHELLALRSRASRLDELLC